MAEWSTEPEATLEAQLLRTIKRCWSTIFSTAVRRALPGHLTPQQLFVLAHLGHRPCQPSELAREHHVGMSAMTGLVDGLVARGLVERRQDPHDRRAIQLEITESGRALWREAQAAVVETAAQFVAPLSAAQRERLSAALRDLDWAMDIGQDCAGVSGERSRDADGVGAGQQARPVAPELG